MNAKTFFIYFWRCEPYTDDDEDPITGDEFDTYEAALAAFNNPASVGPYPAELMAGTGELWVELVRADGMERQERCIRTANPRAAEAHRRDAAEAQRREIAMEAGMLGGCDAYNEAMGY